VGLFVRGGQDDSSCPGLDVGLIRRTDLRGALALAGLVTFLVVGPVGVPNAWADPVFTISQNPALTGNEVSFSYIPGPSEQEAWDLDGDGAFDDAFGPDAVRTYNARQRVMIGLQVTDQLTGTASTGFGQLQVNGPLTDFVTFPGQPAPGQQVTFVYSPVSPVDPSDVRWDLDGDGKFDDGTGPTAFRVFPAAGTYPVTLRVRDRTTMPTDAVSTGTQLITVAPPGTPVTKATGPNVLHLMTPFPVVRITGKVSRKGARIKRLTVRAPYGATVLVRCRGRGCPFKRTSMTLARAGAKTPSATLRVRKLERRLLRGGASVKVLVSRKGEIGKYTAFRIRTAKPPLRTDLCLSPGASAPSECPSS
jgi:PKD domain